MHCYNESQVAYLCLGQHGANLVDAAKVPTVPPDVSARNIASEGQKIGQNTLLPPESSLHASIET